MPITWRFCETEFLSAIAEQMKRISTLQAMVDLLDNRPVPQTALLNMPVIKKDKVD
ncbi:MAG TPA: hypothetical protein VN952_11430 [Chthoniobacterales bacterium]|nr:hypothetical protein [Chthoniobacterales bacterium]